LYTGKAAYSVLIFLVYKNAPGGWKEFEAVLSVLFFCREIYYIFFLKKVLFCILAEISEKYEWNSL